MAFANLRTYLAQLIFAQNTPEGVADGLQNPIWADWRHWDDVERLTWLYRGRFREVYPDVDLFVDTRFLHANLCARTVNAKSAAIYVEAPKVASDDQYATAWATKFLGGPRAASSIALNIKDTCLYGTGVLVLSVKNGKLVVRSINPQFYAPELDPLDVETAVAHNIFFAMDSEAETFIRDRYYLNSDGFWWHTRTRIDAEKGTESDPIVQECMGTTYSPVVMTFSERLSGTHYGKSNVSDVFHLIGAFAANFDRVTLSIAKSNSLFAAPFPDAYLTDHQGNSVLGWTPENPLMVDVLEQPAFDIKAWGYTTSDAASVVDPALNALHEIEIQVYLSMGLSPALFGVTGTITDTGSIGLERLNQAMVGEVQKWQREYGIFFNDLLCAGAEMSTYFNLDNGLAHEMPTFTFEWKTFVPEDPATTITNVLGKVQAGLSQQQALVELGYSQEDAARITAEAAAEKQQTLVLPHEHLPPVLP